MLKGGKRERERFSLGLMKITIPFLNWKYVKIMATRCSVCDTQRIDSKEIVLLRCYHASSFLLVRLAQKSTLSSLHTSVQSFNYRTFARSGIHTCTFRSKRQKIWRPKCGIICKRNLPRCLFATKEWNGGCSMKASDMAYRNGRRLKMVGKMFSKHHWSLSFVYTWENIDFFVAIWIIIRHLVRCGIVEAALSSKLASKTPLDSRAVPMLENGGWDWQRTKGERKASENRLKWKARSIRREKGHKTNLLTTCFDVKETTAERNQNCSKKG